MELFLTSLIRLGTMEFSLPKRRKLAFLFLLGVGLPSFALAILAFRGIQNELALLEQRQLDGYRDLSDRIGDSILAQVDQVESSLSRLVAVQQGAPLSSLMAALDSLRSEHPLLDVAFFLEADGRVRLPTGDLLFRADDEVPRPEPLVWPASAEDAMRRGQEQEFQEGRPTEAFVDYQRAFDSVSDSALRGQALLAMTRVQRKGGRLEGALATCETLRRDYGMVRTADGMPLGAVASLERGDMFLSAGDSLRALATLVELYGSLVAGGWELGKAQYDFLAGQAASGIQALGEALRVAAADSLAEAFASALEEEAAYRSRAERILRFQETAGEDLVARIGAGSEGPGRLSRRLSLDSGGETFLASLLYASSSDPSTWGFLLDSRHLRDSLVGPALEAGVDSSATEWIVRGRDGRTILAGTDSPSGALALNATIAGSFPPWLIEFYPRPQGTLRVLLTSGQSIYVYMFLAIAIILGFGSVVTIRGVTQELELARMKSDFVSTVSHEFKSPLTSIRQLAEMLQMGRVASEERRQRYYDVLVEQSARLSSLVTNVLDLARIEEGRKDFRSEPVDFGALIRELTEATQHRVGHEGFEIRTEIEDPLPKVRGDAEAMRQAISNLLDNALQYSGEAREVRVQAWGEDGGLSVTVEDSGVGIQADEIEKVFDRFYRGRDEVTRSIRGSGLGLTLVKEIVEAHRGSV
ncbi:MAG: HAMP domain-containing sensor histidine kinase, partial [Gemmatimonadota bacterium]